MRCFDSDDMLGSFILSISRMNQYISYRDHVNSLYIEDSWLNSQFTPQTLEKYRNLIWKHGLHILRDKILIVYYLPG